MKTDHNYTRIVTHDDFDGVVSAALLSFVTGIDSFHFTGPVSIQNNRTRTTETDIVCDLPCPVTVGMWFDHHAGNLADLELREIDPASVPGRFDTAPSCARVIYDHFSPDSEFPGYITDTLAGVDRVDSFDYNTMDEWREQTQERKLSDSLMASSATSLGQYGYMTHMIRLLRDGSMEDALGDPEVSAAAAAYSRMEEKSLVLVDQDAFFHPDDPGKEVVIIDLTRHNRRPEMIRNTAFIKYPEALAVLLVGNQFQRGRKTTDLTFSMSLSFLMNTREHNKDIGEIMRELNMGDGHTGAAGGRLDCSSKDEMIRVKEKTLAEMVRLWKSQ
jgi:oligoribonuclease NrnB/cAMP/cGMP phosphodiesterase (DHH superfamily)